MLKRQKTGRVAQKWKHWCGAALLLAGCLIFFSPNLHQQYQDKRIQKEIAEFHMQSEPEEKSDLFGKIQRYNQELFESGQNCLYEPAYVEKAPEIDGIVSDKMFGYVEIPSIDCTLPLYLGASEEKLNQGAAVLGGTSVPIGGNNTNCVIAAHRGWKQQVYFKYIDALKHGDCIIVTNPWERLEYVVSDIQVIEPDEIERIKIQSGTDQVTLITCHPYRSSGKYRYVVSAKRKETGTVGVSEAGKKVFVQDNESAQNCIRTNSDQTIWQETKIRYAGVAVLAGFVIFTVYRNVKGESGKMQKTERVVRKWMRLFMMLGSLLLLFHGSTVFAKAAEAEVKWKVVTQEINEEQQYVYDGDKPDVTINGVFPDQTGNQWGFVDQGMVKDTESILVPNWNGWWHVVNGWVDWNSGIFDTTSGKYKFTNGKCEFPLNQTVEMSGSNGWYLVNGKADETYTGLAAGKDGIYWMTKGKTDSSKNGLVKDTIGVTANQGIIYLTNGKFNSSMDTVAKIDNAWWKVRNGIVDTTYTGLAKNENGWWYLENGKVRFDYNGVAQNENGFWYVSAGMVDFNYTGFAYGYYFVNSRA